MGAWVQKADDQPPAGEIAGEASAGPYVAVLLRHGQREDYIALGQGRGEEWIANAPRPWDPSLADSGVKQAALARERIEQELKDAGLPMPTAVYSSPLIRCVETSNIVASGFGVDDVRVEAGLMEVLSERWYRSFSVPGSNSKFGGGAVDAEGKLLPVAEEEVLPIARGPLSAMIRTAAQLRGEAGPAASKVDAAHVSFISLSDDIRWGAFESKPAMAERVKATVEARTSERPGQTCVFVSHGSPTDGGFAALTGAQATGQGGMCSVSLLVRERAEGPWRGLVQNDASHADAVHEGPRTGLTPGHR